MPAIVLLPSPPGTALVQVDPRYAAARAAAPMGKSLALPSGAALINANYFFNGLPIGVMLDQGALIPCWVGSPHPRTVLAVRGGKAEIATLELNHRTPKTLKERFGADATVIEAGPRLLQAGVWVGSKNEGFADDIYRKTQHTAVGVTAAGKLILAYTESTRLQEIASLLREHGAVEAVNMDGGSSSCVQFAGRTWGYPRPKVVLYFEPYAPPRSH